MGPDSSLPEWCWYGAGWARPIATDPAADAFLCLLPRLCVLLSQAPLAHFPLARQHLALLLLSLTAVCQEPSFAGDVFSRKLIFRPSLPQLIRKATGSGVGGGRVAQASAAVSQQGRPSLAGWATTAMVVAAPHSNRASFRSTMSPGHWPLRCTTASRSCCGPAEAGPCRWKRSRSFCSVCVRPRPPPPPWPPCHGG